MYSFVCVHERVSAHVHLGQACNVHICMSIVVEVYAQCQYVSCLLNDLVNK